MMYFKMIERKGYLYSLCVGFNKYKFTLLPMFYLTAHSMDFIVLEVGWLTLIARFDKVKRLTDHDVKSVQELLNSVQLT